MLLAALRLLLSSEKAKSPVSLWRSSTGNTVTAKVTPVVFVTRVGPSDTAPADVTLPSRLVTETDVALVSVASLPVQPRAAAVMWPAPPLESLADRVQLGAVSVTVRAPREVAVPPGVKFVVNSAPVPAE